MAKRNPPREKDPHAVALGKRGGAKGGRTRAARMTPEERAEAASRASLARWRKGEPPSPVVPEVAGVYGGDMVDLAALTRAVVAAALHQAQTRGIKLDQDTAFLALVERVGSLAKVLSPTGARGKISTRAQSQVAEELVEVLASVLVMAQVLGIDLAEVLRKKSAPRQ